MAPDIKITLRDNVRALLALPPEKSGVSKLIALGISNGNAQRILEAETNIRIDLLGQVAKLLRLQPWQLLVPGIAPDHLPELVRENRPREELSRDEARLVGLMRELPADDQRKLLRLAGALQPLQGDPADIPVQTEATTEPARPR